MKGKLRFILGFGLFFTGLWFLWDTPIVYPLKIFVVLLHELSHAIAVWMTGGVVNQITLDPYQGGATYFTGGNEILALSAGYLGSLFWGALMFLTANQPRIRKDWVNSTIGLSVILLTIFFVRSGFGIAFGIFFGAMMITVSRRIGELWNKRVLLALGLTSALYAILDIKDDVLDRPEIRSDAWMLAETTGIGNATMWGALWIFIAIFVSTRLMMRAFEDA